MPDFFLLFSHTLTNDQKEDAWRTFGVQNFIPLPEDLQARWSNVPPETDTVDDHLWPILEWLRKQSQPGDYVLIQGDFGMTYLAVAWAFQQGLIPVYATNRRQSVETVLPDGTVPKQSIFKHVRFRTYQQIQESLMNPIAHEPRETRERRR